MNVVIAKYTFDNTIEDVIPTFNDEFEYDFIDVVEGDITTRCINGHNDKLYNISFRDSIGLLEVEYINTKGFESLNSMFRNCKNLEKIDLSRFNTDNVIDFNSMFYLCKNLSEVNMVGLEPEVVNKYIEWLPNRKSPLSGIIMLDDITDIDIAAANDKSWEIVNSIIVKYVFDSNIEEDVSPNVDTANTAKLIYLNKKDNICTKALVLCDEEAVAPVLLDFANSKGLLEIKKIECEGLLQLTDMFFKCSNLTKVRFDSGGYTFSDVTNMFYGCESLTELDFSKFETHYNVTTARNMFAGCTNLKNVTGLSQIFYSNLIDASYMFKDCVSLTSIDMNYIYIYNEMMGMFEGCTNLVEIKNFNYIQDVLIAVNMFKDCKSLTDISFACQFYEETVATDMFAGCDKLERVHLDKVDSFTANRIIDVLPVVEENSHHVLVTGDNIIDEEAAAAKNWENRCYYLYNIVITESGNTPSVSFDTTSEHNQLVKYKKMSDSTYESACYADLLPTRYQFSGLSTKLLSVSYICTDNVTNMTSMFYGCSNLTSLDLSSFNTSKVTNMTHMIYECNKLTSLDLSNFNTSEVTGMSWMFASCNNLTSIEGLSNFNTGKVTNMSYMFYDCSKLTSLDLSSFDTSKVTNMREMFYGCNKLTSLDLCSFNTSKVNIMTQMFSSCSNLTSLDLSNFSWTNVPSDYFSGCSKLREVDVTNISTNSLEYLIESLPSRTANSPGIIRTGNCKYTEENYNAVNAKNWIIEPNADVTDLKRTIAKYTFNSVTDTLPELIFNNQEEITLTFNPGFTSSLDKYTFGSDLGKYDIVSVIIDGYDASFSKEKFNDYDRYTIEDKMNSELQHYNILLYDSGDCTFNAFEPSITKSVVLTLREMPYTSDVDNGDGTITRTITSNSLPSSMRFKSCSGLINVIYLNTSNIADMKEMFYYCPNLTSIDLSSFDTSKVTNMENMFYGCSSLTTLDVSNFDTSKVTNMRSMFNMCQNLQSIDVSNFDTTKVTDMRYMFHYCNGLTTLDVSNFNTSKVTNMSGMFSICYNLTSLDLSNFNTSIVTDMGYMFEYCTKLTTLDVSNFDTSNVTDMKNIFFDCSNLTYIRAYNMPIASINKLISVLPPLSSPNYGILRIGKTDMTDVDITTANDNLWFINGLKIAEYEFSTDFDPVFNIGFEYVAITNGSNKVIMSNGMRPTSISFEEDNNLINLMYLDTSELTNMGYLFTKCKNLTTINLSNFDTSKVTTMQSMFSNCGILETMDLSSFDTSNVTNMQEMFYGCDNLALIDLSSWDTSNVNNMSDMFYFCENLTTINLSNFDTSKVTKMSRMFQNCSNLVSIEGLNDFNTSNVTTMLVMFGRCRNLQSLDLSSFNTSKVTDMNSMFWECKALTTLDLSSFNTSKVTDMRGIFYDCNNLKSLNISNFSINETTETTDIFDNCNNLTRIRLDDSDMNTINTLISLLPERNSIGKIYVTGIEDVSGIDKATAVSKKWKIVVKENRMITFAPINLGGKSIRAIYTNNESYL